MSKESFDYKEWYEKNKETVNKHRQDKYDSDPEYRAKAIARARYYYWTKKRKNEISKPVDTDEVKLETKKTIKIDIQNPADARYGTSIEVPVYDAGQLGKYMERTAQTVRWWERQGITPKAFWRDGRGYRLYTEDQVIAFLECKHYLDMPMKNIRDSVFAREIKKAIENMPDGVKVEEAKDMEVRGECGRCHSLTNKVVKSYEVDHVRCSRCGGALLPQTKMIQEV